MTRLQQPIELDIKQFFKVIIFAPHPDDEAIGCGGLLLKLVKNNIDIKAILVSDGGGGGALPQGTSDIREKEFLASLAALGVDNYDLWGLTDGSLEHISNLYAMIENEILAYEPDIVIAPWYLDMHPDHSTVGHCIKKCADKGVVDVLFYEVWTPLECTHILDITDVISIKNKAIECHITALQYGNYIDGINGLTTYRGLYLPFERKIKYAEAYNFYSKNNKNWIKKLWQK